MPTITRRKFSRSISLLVLLVTIVSVGLYVNHKNRHEISFFERGALIQQNQQQQRILKSKKTTYVDIPLNEEPLINLRSIGEFPLDVEDNAFFWWAPLAGCAKAEDIIRECNLFQGVDTTSLEGIDEFSKESTLYNLTLDVLVSPYFNEAAGLFNSDHPGRAFTFVRDPIKRELAHFHELNTRDQSHEEYNSALGSMTLAGYVNSDYASNNWLTRHLLGKLEGTINESDLEAAKAILREKVLVLLVEDTDETISYRLRHYFGSSGKQMGGTWDCIGNLVKDRYDNFEFPEIKKNTHEYAMLTRNNNFDIKLYRYCRYLYEHQRIMMDRKEDEHEQEILFDIVKKAARAKDISFGYVEGENAG